MDIQGVGIISYLFQFQNTHKIIGLNPRWFARNQTKFSMMSDWSPPIRTKICTYYSKIYTD